MYAIGYDIGSSSIKAALVEIRGGRVIARRREPAGTETPIDAPRPGWAEQDPESWWHHVCAATRHILTETGIDPTLVQSVGIGYQMHGLVLVDDDLAVVRPAIIWCDSRAVDQGETAFQRIGPDRCLDHCLNSPGNFTAAKLKWVAENEPAAYTRTRHAMLPGDFIALRLSGNAGTTIGGLSEGILWDFRQHAPARIVLDALQLDAAKLPEPRSNPGIQAYVSAAGAAAAGLTEGTIIGYRAGDQPNNALALNVLDPGEVAATAGTSGVVYGVTDRLLHDPLQRVNGFAHVNHTAAAPRIGVLLCINGAGSLHRWLREQVCGRNLSYAEMETAAAAIPTGSDGLSFLPFGNGAERMLQNRNVGAHLLGLDLNRHRQAHLIRAGIEGVAFAFVYGMRIMQKLGIDLGTIRVGDDNLFQSTIFSTTIAALTGAKIEVFHTTGAVGAALAGAAGAGLTDDLRASLSQQRPTTIISAPADITAYETAYRRWETRLDHLLKLPE